MRFFIHWNVGTLSDQSPVSWKRLLNCRGRTNNLHPTSTSLRTQPPSSPTTPHPKPGRSRILPKSEIKGWICKANGWEGCGCFFFVFFFGGGKRARSQHPRDALPSSLFSWLASFHPRITEHPSRCLTSGLVNALNNLAWAGAGLPLITGASEGNAPRYAAAEGGGKEWAEERERERERGKGGEREREREGGRERERVGW